MPGKLPIDRVREAWNAPKIFDEHRERLARQQAELRDADDPVGGARPPASGEAEDSANESSRTDSTKDA